MGKSKTIGTIHIAVTDKKLDREELFDAIETNLFPIWEEKSGIAIRLTTKYECWRELIGILYHNKMLNIAETYNQLKYQKEKEE